MLFVLLAGGSWIAQDTDMWDWRDPLLEQLRPAVLTLAPHNPNVLLFF